MSYCVNCGVELSKGTNVCPLCDTPVINPNKRSTENEYPAFPENVELPKGVRKRYVALIISFVMLLPNIVCLMTNLFLTPKMLWSVYVISTSLLVWFLFILPFLIKNKHPYLLLTIDAFITAAYIFVFYYYNSPRDGWFTAIALPAVFGLFLSIGILTFLLSKKRTTIFKIISVLTTITVFLVYFCVIFNLYEFSAVVSYVCLILALSSLLLLIFFIIAYKNHRLRLWLSRKLFF